MNKQLIGTLVAGLILFIWQFISWNVMNLHQAEMQYTPKQDQIMEALTQLDLEEGHYFVPTVPPGASMEDQEKLMESMVGKPWATVSYHQAFEVNMGMNMTRGFLLDLVSAFLLIWVLMKFRENNFMTSLLASLAVGSIGYLTIPYLHQVWMETDSTGYLIDTIVQWGLVGAWLGWWLNRK